MGGGARTAELEQGHLHDLCSAVHPMAVASPFFSQFELQRRIEFAVPDISYAHPLDGGRAGVAFRDLTRTVEGLGHDGPAYRRLMEPLVRNLEGTLDVALNHLVRVPRHPVTAARFGLAALDQGTPLWNRRFSTDVAAALFTGVAAHPVGTLPSLPSAGAGLTLGALAHAGGWPIPLGGSQSIADSMVDDIRAHGGKMVTDHAVRTLSELSGVPLVLLDIAPPALLQLADGMLPRTYARALERFRFGNGACKVAYNLSGPVPWSNGDVAQAGTVHLGGTREEIVASEAQVAAGKHAENPYVLLSQPSLFDPSRAPEGRHVLWTYCHVPSGSTLDMAEAVTAQIERFAPGFRDVVVSSFTTTADELAASNANYVGGDFGGGAVTLAQMVARPVLSHAPWRTPLDGVYLCSASTPPGPGVHGMSGFHAARLALRQVFGLGVPALGVRREKNWRL